MSGTVRTLSVPVVKGHRQVVKRILAAVVCALVCAGALHAGQAKPKKNEIRHQILDLEDSWRNAVLKSDITLMNTLLAEDYMAITPSGMLQTKGDALANLRTHRVRMTSMVLSDRKVRLYGKTAIVTSLAEVQGTTPEGDLNGSFRYTRVYVRDAQGKWKIVSFESNRVRQGGERRKQEPGPSGE